MPLLKFIQRLLRGWYCLANTVIACVCLSLSEGVSSDALNASFTGSENHDAAAFWRSLSLSPLRYPDVLSTYADLTRTEQSNRLLLSTRFIIYCHFVRQYKIRMTPRKWR